MSYFEYEYSVIESDCEVEGYQYTGYGICVSNLKSGERRSFCDISPRRREVEELAERCNRLRLDPVHIDDVIDDFLCIV